MLLYTQRTNGAPASVKEAHSKHNKLNDISMEIQQSNKTRKQTGIFQIYIHILTYIYIYLCVCEARI